MTFGGSGNDVIIGGAGNDTISGGGGADVFEFSRTSTETMITDFDASEGDVLRFYNRGGVVFDINSVQFSQTGGLTLEYVDVTSSSRELLRIDLGLNAPGPSEALLETCTSAIEIVFSPLIWDSQAPLPNKTWPQPADARNE
ncbi:Hemolysin-type calcium-binding repeat-containing protein [Jannaschia faecimaris]|uniref:Hemolysin-type calcium-binding repeat-containing protein n=1 Tax=Jannaschia faecimaris TaxID=1244108 RepID=A0A1H3KA77_9RHOB|nr:Hemolysin-type calcium-binding repeat-containing protein [Jannaschia faecimaris]